MNIFKKSKIRYYLSILAIISVFAGVIYFAFFRTETAEAVWFDESWTYRQIVEISNSGSAQTDFQSKIDMDTATLITAGKMQSDCDDIRVTDINGRLLYHWIEGDTGACNTSSTDIWVKVPSIETSGATVYIYYGNSITNNVENGKEVFELFDDFNSVSGAWQTTSGDPNIASGVVEFSPTAESLPGSADSDIYITLDGSASGQMLKSGPVWIDPSTAYAVFLGSNDDIFYSKTTDGGTTWGAAVTVSSAASRKVSLWYDRWTPGNYGNLIHIVYVETIVDDALHRSLDVTTDTLSTETIIFNGASVDTSNGGWDSHIVDIVRTRGGNLISCFAIDAVGENGCSRSVDDGANWTSRADIFDGNAVDIIMLMPGGETDSNDILAVYEDRNANDLTIKTYDDSADSWSESTKLGDSDSSNFVQNVGASQRHSDNHVIVAVWNTINSGIADLNVYDVTNGTTWTQKTDAISNTDNASNSTVFINQQNDDIYVGYRYGPTWQSSMDAYYTKSTDGGTTWDTEVQANVSTGEIRDVYAGLSVGFEGGWFMLLWDDAGAQDLEYNKGLSVSIPTTEGVISKDTFTQGNYALRFRSKISATTGAGRGRLGFSNTSAFTNDFRADDAASIFVGLGSSDLNLETINDTTIQSSSDYTKDTSYHVNEIRWGSSSITLYEDGTLKATNSTQVPNEASNVRLEKGIDGTLSVDWVFVRKYAATEPSVGSPSSEEKGPGPVAHWKFDEGYGTTANDSTINANNGTIANSAWQQEDLCLNEKCLYFDGTGDYSTSGLSFTHLDSTTDDSGTNITSASISPEPNSLLLVYSISRKGSDPGVPTVTDTLTDTGAWAEAGGSRFDATAGGDTRVALHYAQVGPSPGSGTVNVDFGTTNLNMSTDIIQVTGFDPDNPIVQQATVQDGGSATQEVTLLSFADPLNNAAVGFFVQQQIVASATPGSGFTELSDTQHIDGGGSSHTVETEYKIGEDTVVDVTWTVTDGSGGYAVEIAANAQQDQFNFAASDSFTVGGWIKHNTQSSGQDVILAKYESTGADGGYKLLMEADGDITFGIDDDNTSFPEDSVTSTAATYDDNQWHHVAGVKNGTTDIKLYIDGQLIATDSTIAATGTLANKDAFYIGIDGDGSSNDWLGFLDDIKIYSYARSADQIKTDYNARGGPIGASAVLGARDQAYISNGLQGYWKMDESSLDSCTGGTNDACDSSGNGYDGAITTATQVVGKFGNGVSFDGTDDYISMGDIDDFEFTSDFTVAGWVYPTNLDGTNEAMASKGCGASNGWLAGIKGTSDLAHFKSNSVDITGNTVLVNSTWYHIAFSINSSGDVSIYVNGQLDNTPTNLTMTTNTSANVNIGGCNDITSDFEGTIDEIRLYSRAFTPKEVRDLYNWAPGPIGYWDLNENTGTTANDLSGNDNTGTITNTEATDWVPGKFGSALDLDGTDEYIDAGDIFNNVNLPVTIEAWIYEQGSGAQGIFGSDDNTDSAPTDSGSYYGFWMNVESDNTIFLSIGDGTGSASSDRRSKQSSTAITANKWTHVAGVIRSTTDMDIYIDGVDAGGSTSGTGGAMVTNNYPARIGVRSRNVGYLDGFIDDVRIYDYARSQKQVVEDMNTGHPTGGSPVGSQTGYWKFDEGYGTTANDTIGVSSIDGTITGATWTDQASCKINKCLDFDGNDYVQVTGLLGSPAAITLTAWVDLDTADTLGSEIISLGDHVALRLDDTQDTPDNGVNGFYYTGSTWNVTDTELNFAGTGLHHYAYIVDPSNSTQSIYIDGLLRGSSTFSDAISYAGLGSNTQIGRHGDGVSLQDVDGRIDEVRVYSSALTQDEILVDMNTGSSINFGAGINEAADLTDGVGNPPVGYWGFDENTGTSTVYDKGTGQNDGTMNGSMTEDDWVSGKYGSALDFDGSDDGVTVSTALSTPANFTLSVWIYPTADGQSSRSHIAGRSKSTGCCGNVYGIRRDSDNIIDFSTQTTDSNTLSSVTTAPTDQWTHVTVWKSGTTKRIYINGIFEVESTHSGTLEASTATEFFAELNSSQSPTDRRFEGYIDEVRFYDYARTQAQVAYDFNRGAPIAHWKLDECSGTTAYDSSLKADASASRNDGTITIGGTGSNTIAGTCTSPTDGTGAWYDGKTGKFNSSLDFDGTDDYIQVSGLLDSNATAITLTAWADLDAADTQGGEVISLGDHVTLRLDDTNESPDSGVRGFYYTGSTWNATDTELKFAGTGWHHYAYVVDPSNSTQSIYIDGLLRGSSTFSNAISFASLGSNTRIGKHGNTGTAQDFDGQIDDVQVYNYALSETQIRNVMNQNAAIRFGPTTGSP